MVDLNWDQTSIDVRLAERDEIDFEFLSDVSGQPYILQTNFDNREERIYLRVNKFVKNQIIRELMDGSLFAVSLWIPSLLRRTETTWSSGWAFPRWQQMGVKATLGDGDIWGTRGERDMVNWSKGPSWPRSGTPRLAPVSGRAIRGLAGRRAPQTGGTTRRWFKWVRRHHMIYDCCQDNARFENNLPRECFLPKY